MSSNVVRDWITFGNVRDVDYGFLTPSRVLKSAQASLGVTQDGFVGPMTLGALGRTLSASLRSVPQSSPWHAGHTDAIRAINNIEPGKRIPTILWAWLAKIGAENLYAGDDLGQITVSAKVRPVFRMPRLSEPVGTRATGFMQPVRPVMVVPSGMTDVAASEAEAVLTEKPFVADVAATETVTTPPREVTTIVPQTPPTADASFYTRHRTKILAGAAVTIGVGVLVYAFYGKDD